LKKRNFKKDSELHDELVKAREAGMSLDDIAKKFPQYSKVTYKKLFSRLGIRGSKDYFKSEAFLEKQRIAQKKSWDERGAEARDKHIEHLRLLNKKTRDSLCELRFGQVLGYWTVIDCSLPAKPICKCRCGTVRAVGYYDMLYGASQSCGCKPVYSSYGETELRQYIESLGLEVRKLRDGLEIDLFVQSVNIGVEYHGEFWHSEYTKRKDYHLAKLKHFESRGIRLIQIFENEWISKKDQIKSYLRSAFGLNQTLVAARKCEVTRISANEASAFLKKNHMQGARSGDLYLSLVLSGEILAVAVFGRHHRKRSGIVMSRFATTSGVSVQGGLSRLSRHAFRQLGVPIISWCDLRWSDGSGYKKAGWVQDAVLPPDYFYVKGKKIIPKQSRRKKAIGTPHGMTEHEHALLDGLYRVYDCGKIRFIFKG